MLTSDWLQWEGHSGSIGGIGVQRGNGEQGCKWGGEEWGAL